MIYPVGVQSFEKLRKSGSVYVDKTDFVWNLANQPSPIFLSRPRRFGKSLFLSTLEAYFLGKKDLFEGLAIAECEKDWVVYPVFHFDFNTVQPKSVKELEIVLDQQLSGFEAQFGIVPAEKNAFAVRLTNLINVAESEMKRPAVILVDEYDKPLLNTSENPQLRTELSALLKSFYGVTKSSDAKIRFAMFTGVARFSKTSIFSDLNNLYDISLSNEYNSICGISETELHEYFTDSVRELAESYEIGFEEMKSVLKKKYDGYNFSDPKTSECLYNPFSILSCFRAERIDDYWFDSGTPSFLVKTLIKDGQDLPALYEDIKVDSRVLKGINTPEKSPLTTLFQTGYLTIKAYDKWRNEYTLGFPNQEVVSGFNQLASIVDTTLLIRPETVRSSKSP